MKYIILIPLFLSYCFAQTPKPSDRMGQDLHVMTEVLHELFEASHEVSGFRFRSNNQEARYQSGFGVVLYAPPVRQFTGASSGSKTGAFMTLSPSSSSSAFDLNSWNPDSAVKVIERNMRFFLQQYGDLAGELKDDEKIMIVYDPKSEHNGLTFYRGSARASFPGTPNTYQGLISATVMLKDIKAFRSGKISAETFQDRVSMQTEKREAKNQLEYRVFGKILSERLYEVEKEKRHATPLPAGMDYFSFPSVKVEMKVLEGLGATYEIVWGGKYGNSFELITKSPRRRETPSKETLILDKDGKKEAAKDGEELMEKFKKTIPEIMISYGRTLRNIKPSELLTVVIHTPYCEDCEKGKEISFSIKGETLRAYDRNEISLAEAIRKVGEEEQ